MQKKEELKPIAQLILMGIVAAMYVALSLPFGSFAFGPLQFRISELFNHLAAFNKRYIIAVSLGVLIANFLFSPYGIIDVIVGTGQTLIMTIMIYFATKKINSVILKVIISTVITTLMMWIIALEIAILANTAAFWPTFWGNYATLMLSELVSMILGAIVIVLVSKKFDLTK